MTGNQVSPNLDDSPVGETACGARIYITPETPYIHYREGVVYFCGQDCKEIYEEDPLNSCLSARILSGK